MKYLTPEGCVFKTPLSDLKKERDRNRRAMRQQQLFALLCRAPDLAARRAYELFEKTDRYQGLGRGFDERLERYANANEELLREFGVGQFPFVRPWRVQ
jgi:hypothetical protein